MKLLLAVAFTLVSASSCASTEIIMDRGVEANPVIAQKAQDSGIVFLSNADQYQLIAGGRATKSEGLASVMTASKSQEQSELLWQGTNGTFVLSISDHTVSQQRAQALASSSSSYNQIAYNPRTGGIGVITGQIIVSYTDGFDSEFLEASYGIQLLQDFAHLKTAFYTVNVGQDIFLITDYLNKGGLVIKAEVEVMENFAVPN